jgi:hypothetical protein
MARQRGWSAGCIGGLHDESTPTRTAGRPMCSGSIQGRSSPGIRHRLSRCAGRCRDTGGPGFDGWQDAGGGASDSCRGSLGFRYGGSSTGKSRRHASRPFSDFAGCGRTGNIGRQSRRGAHARAGWCCPQQESWPPEGQRRFRRRWFGGRGAVPAAGGCAGWPRRGATDPGSAVAGAVVGRDARRLGWRRHRYQRAERWRGEGRRAQTRGRFARRRCAERNRAGAGRQGRGDTAGSR